MAIELRVLSGARAGQAQSFTQRRVVAGRDPSCDLCFDMTHDLDVSARHAELRERGGSWIVRDSGSTNGTYVNHVRLETGSVRALRSGDVIGFGANGPTVSVEFARVAPKTVMSRLPTGERVAIAVKEQTRGLKLALVLAIVVIAALIVGIAWAKAR